MGNRQPPGPRRRQEEAAVAGPRFAAGEGELAVAGDILNLEIDETDEGPGAPWRGRKEGDDVHVALAAWRSRKGRFLSDRSIAAAPPYNAHFAAFCQLWSSFRQLGATICAAECSIFGTPTLKVLESTATF